MDLLHPKGSSILIKSKRTVYTGIKSAKRTLTHDLFAPHQFVFFFFRKSLSCTNVKAHLSQTSKFQNLRISVHFQVKFGLVQYSKNAHRLYSKVERGSKLCYSQVPEK